MGTRVHVRNVVQGVLVWCFAERFPCHGPFREPTKEGSAGWCCSTFNLARRRCRRGASSGGVCVVDLRHHTQGMRRKNLRHCRVLPVSPDFPSQRTNHPSPSTPMQEGGFAWDQGFRLSVLVDVAPPFLSSSPLLAVPAEAR